MENFDEIIFIPSEIKYLKFDRIKEFYPQNELANTTRFFYSLGKFRISFKQEANTVRPTDQFPNSNNVGFPFERIIEGSDIVSINLHYKSSPNSTITDDIEIYVPFSSTKEYPKRNILQKTFLIEDGCLRIHIDDDKPNISRINYYNEGEYLDIEYKLLNYEKEISSLEWKIKSLMDRIYELKNYSQCKTKIKPRNKQIIKAICQSYNITSHDLYCQDLWAAKIDNKVEVGDLEYIASEYCGTSLRYSFYTTNQDGEITRDHEHTFSNVIFNLIQAPASFSIKGFEVDYSKQELNFLKKLQIKLKDNRDISIRKVL